MINKIIKRLKYSWLSVIVLAGILSALYELNIINIGLFSDNISVVYALQMIGIILVLPFIYLSLKLFTIKNVKKSFIQEDESLAMMSFYRYSNIRIGLLGISIIFNLVVYYLTLSDTGLMCALISALAFFFCWPRAEQFTLCRLEEENDTKENDTKEK